MADKKLTIKQLQEENERLYRIILWCQHALPGTYKVIIRDFLNGKNEKRLPSIAEASDLSHIYDRWRAKTP